MELRGGVQAPAPDGCGSRRSPSMTPLAGGSRATRVQGSPRPRQFNRKHDTLFWYAKGESCMFTGMRCVFPTSGSIRIGPVP